MLKMVKEKNHRPLVFCETSLQDLAAERWEGRGWAGPPARPPPATVPENSHCYLGLERQQQPSSGTARPCRCRSRGALPQGLGSLFSAAFQCATPWGLLTEINTLGSAKPGGKTHRSANVQGLWLPRYSCSYSASAARHLSASVSSCRAFPR